jgi:hypothetical protein
MGLSIDEIAEELEVRLAVAGLLEKLEHWDVNAHVRGGEVKLVSLDRMTIFRKHLKQGHAHRVLAVFTAFCDEQQLDAELTVRPLHNETENGETNDDKTDIERLFRLYSAHGFVRTGAGHHMFRACHPPERV